LPPQWTANFMSALARARKPARLSPKRGGVHFTMPSEIEPRITLLLFLPLSSIDNQVPSKELNRSALRPMTRRLHPAGMAG
jgi:hypothetical protein